MASLKNTKKAAEYLECSENWIHKLVSQGRLTAHFYDENGKLMERAPENKQQGKSMYFYESELKRYKSKTQRGRPTGEARIKHKNAA